MEQIALERLRDHRKLLPRRQTSVKKKKKKEKVQLSRRYIWWLQGPYFQWFIDKTCIKQEECILLFFNTLGKNEQRQYLPFGTYWFWQKGNSSCSVSRAVCRRSNTRVSGAVREAADLGCVIHCSFWATCCHRMLRKGIWYHHWPLLNHFQCMQQCSFGHIRPHKQAFRIQLLQALQHVRMQNTGPENLWKPHLLFIYPWMA